MNTIVDKIQLHKILPVVVIDDADTVIPLAEELISRNLPLIEITFRTEAAEDSIRFLENSAIDILIGAGTILNCEQAERAVSAGAQYIVTPGFSSKVVSWCIKNEIPVFPGVATPTEMMLALEHSVNIVKFFPSEALGGVGSIKALSSPFAMMKFIPTGGISEKNIIDYLSVPSVLACGGSWLASRRLLKNKEFDKIGELISQVKRIIQTLD